MLKCNGIVPSVGASTEGIRWWLGLGGFFLLPFRIHLNLTLMTLMTFFNGAPKWSYGGLTWVVSGSFNQPFVFLLIEGWSLIYRCHYNEKYSNMKSSYLPWPTPNFAFFTNCIATTPDECISIYCGKRMKGKNEMLTRQMTIESRHRRGIGIQRSLEKKMRWTVCTPNDGRDSTRSIRSDN